MRNKTAGFDPYKHIYGEGAEAPKFDGFDFIQEDDETKEQAERRADSVMILMGFFKSTDKK